ncbi:hypothetical protein HDU98_002635, partial [Podochytrium sp. JEL0797]
HIAHPSHMHIPKRFLTTTPTPQFAPRPFATVPTSPFTAQIYVLPTLNNKLVFHARLPVPSNPAERALIVAGYAMRKLRYAVWDETVAASWHSYLGASTLEVDQTNPNTKLKRWIYETGNKWGTRKADGEYFFKGIPLRTTRVEFVIPSSVPVRLVKAQLGEYMQSTTYSKPLFLATVVAFPATLFVAKVLMPIANVVFCYLGFRMAGAWRALTVSGRVRTLVDLGRVTFTESDAFQKRIEEVVGEVEKEEGWKWDGKGDLHDAVVGRLEKEMKMWEWGRSYRRGRMVQFVQGLDTKN